MILNTYVIIETKSIKLRFLDFNLNYTYTSTYDGAEQDDPIKNQNYTNAQMVRVPRNIINNKTSKLSKTT